LSTAEIRALADAFTDPVSARHVLEDAGIPARRHPPWHGSPEQFWRELNTLLHAGVVADGRTRLLAAALSHYPANPVFAAGLAAEEASRPGVGRVRPSTALLPPLPSRFVPRGRDLAALRDLLVDRRGGPVVGVVGMGGAGKSTLARSLVHDVGVREAFGDGIVWVEVNPNPDLAQVVAEVLRAFGDTRPVLDLVAAGRWLRTLLAGARCLVVLDDVWHVDVLDALPVPAGVRLLVTTRTREALYTDSAYRVLGPAGTDTAREVLAAYAAWRVERLPPAAEVVLERCGGLPLALALAGSLIAHEWRWREVADALDAGDLDSLVGRFEDGYRYRNLLAALDASVRLLPGQYADRFRELAVFKGRGPVPTQVVVRLWQATAGMTACQSGDLLRRFSGLSLVRLEGERRTVSTHDLLFDYARVTLPEGRVAELHAVLVADLLGRWGGLSERLPRLRDVEVFDDVDRYGSSALVAHLLAAGRRDTLDELLAVEWPAGPGRADNVWYTVHENLGRTGDYLTAIRAVRRDAQSLPASNIAESLSRQITCALILGSLTSIAGNIPPVLLMRLVDEGVWPPARALAYAQSNPNTRDRARALAGLAPYLPDDQRGPVLVQALEAVTSIDDPYFRAEALAGLAPHLPDDQRGTVLAQALEAATAIDRTDSRVDALVGLARYLPADLLAQALEAATAIDNSYRRAEALAGLVPHLPDDQRGTVLAQALETVTTASAYFDSADRLDALVGLAPHLPDDQRGTVLAQALEAATAGRFSPVDWTKVLAGLAPLLSDDQRGTVLAQALDAATTSAWNSNSLVDALVGLAPHLSVDQLAQALEAATAITGKHRMRDL
jgi:hypothetical protein